MGRRTAAPEVDAAAIDDAWNLSCPDWWARLQAGRSLVPVLPLNLDMATRAVRAFDMLRLSDVPGTPTVAEAGGDWFRDIVGALFGSLSPDERRRRIREVFCLVPKKNAKTTYGALLMLVALLLNSRPRAPFIMTAPVHDTADLAFSAAAGAIALDPVLSAKLHVREHVKTIIHRETKAELQIMTFDPETLTGQKVAGVLIDELHVVARKHKAASAIRQLRGGMLPFPEAFIAFITTQSEESPAGIFKAELAKARKIRDGELRGMSMLPVMYEYPLAFQKSAAWRDPKHWHLVNPNMGRGFRLEDLLDLQRTAEQEGDGAISAWASQHLNIEVGVAIKADAWAGAEYWPLGADASLTLDEVLRRSDVVTMGIDGGGLDDLLSAVVLGREAETGHWLHWQKSWCTREVLKRRKDISERLLDFERDGDLVIVERIGKDITQLGDLVEHVEESELLDKIGVDQSGLGSIVTEIESRGVAQDRIVGIPQGWRLNGAIKATERKVAAGELRHGDRAIMEWVNGNAKVEQRGNAISITKQAAGFAKIDPLAATFDAAEVMSRNPEARDGGEQVFFV